jgi:hypothetical protein
MERCRNAFSAEELAGVLVANTSKPNFLQYRETSKPKTGAIGLNAKAILGCKTVFRELHKLAKGGGMSATGSTCKTAMNLVLRSSEGGPWAQKVKAEHQPDYIKSMSKRLQHALTDINSSLHKGKRPQWLELLFSDDDAPLSADSPREVEPAAGDDQAEGREEEEEAGREDEDAKGEEDEQDETDEEVETLDAEVELKVEQPTAMEGAGDAKAYTYGYSHELHQAFRKGDWKSSKREYTDVFANAKSLDTDFVRARFAADGSDVIITDITVAELKTREQAEWESFRGALWAGEVDGSDIKLFKAKQKGEETLVLYKYTTPEDGNGSTKRNQIVQIFMRKFSGPLKEQRAKAKSVGSELGQLLQNKTIDESGLTAARDKLTRRTENRAPLNKQKVALQKKSGSRTAAIGAPRVSFALPASLPASAPVLTDFDSDCDTLSPPVKKQKVVLKKPSHNPTAASGTASSSSALPATVPAPPASSPEGRGLSDCDSDCDTLPPLYFDDGW